MFRTAVICGVLLAPVLAVDASAQERRSGLQPCRIGAQALIQYLDSQEQAGADYADAYRMVETCGPPRTQAHRKVPVRAVTDAKACRDLALKMLDELDEGRLTRPSFVKAREDFAVACAPAKGIEPNRAPAR
jgi:hypothetical protein